MSDDGYCCPPDSGDCCGPGSWCCARAGKHGHDDEGMSERAVFIEIMAGVYADHPDYQEEWWTSELNSVDSVREGRQK